MANVLYATFYIAIAIKWGDWKNRKKYYPTILFFMVGDLLYQFLFFKYSMWEYVPIGNDGNWATHTHISLLIMLIKYPLTIMVFLGHLPEKIGRYFLYVSTWTFLYFINESIDLKVGGIVHKHGWNIGWSTLFSFVMFNILALHYKYPLLAWMCSAAFALFLWKALHVPLTILK